MGNFARAGQNNSSPLKIFSPTPLMRPMLQELKRDCKGRSEGKFGLKRSKVFTNFSKTDSAKHKQTREHKRLNTDQGSGLYMYICMYKFVHTY